MSHIPLQSEPQDALSRRLNRALETAPAFTIPEDFAARVASVAALSIHPAAPFQATSFNARFSKLATRIAFALLVLAMLLFAPWARTQTTVPVAVEMMLAAEFVALTTWLTLRNHSAG